MKTVFVDAAYWVALLNPHDDLHDRAITVGRPLVECVFVTTEMVLTEVLNFFAERGNAPRRAAVELIRRLREDANARIVAQTSAQFDEALQLYGERLDKGWSRTDCASFGVMEKQGITEALTYDDHLEQAAFKALMR